MIQTGYFRLLVFACSARVTCRMLAVPEVTRIVLSYPQAPTSTSSAMRTICCSRGITGRQTGPIAWTDSLAPWFCIPQTLSALHCPCWKAWHSTVPPPMARATALPAIGFANGGLPPRAAGLAGVPCWRSLAGAEKFPAGYVALMTWPSVRVDSLKRLTQSALSSVSLCWSHARRLA